MSLQDIWASALPEQFTGVIYEGIVKTPTEISYKTNKQMLVSRLEPELPPYVWLKPQERKIEYSIDGEKYHITEENGLWVLRLLDPRPFLKEDVLRDIKIVSIEPIKSRIILGKYSVWEETFMLPDDLISWFKENEQEERHLILSGDGDRLRAITQLDLPPTTDVVSVVLRYPREIVDESIIRLTLCISISILSKVLSSS